MKEDKKIYRRLEAFVEIINAFNRKKEKLSDLGFESFKEKLKEFFPENHENLLVSVEVNDAESFDAFLKEAQIDDEIESSEDEEEIDSPVLEKELVLTLEQKQKEFVEFFIKKGGSQNNLENKASLADFLIKVSEENEDSRQSIDGDEYRENVMKTIGYLGEFESLKRELEKGIVEDQNSREVFEASRKGAAADEDQHVLAVTPPRLETTISDFVSSMEEISFKPTCNFFTESEYGTDRINSLFSIIFDAVTDEKINNKQIEDIQNFVIFKLKENEHGSSADFEEDTEFLDDLAQAIGVIRRALKKIPQTPQFWRDTKQAIKYASESATDAFSDAFNSFFEQDIDEEGTVKFSPSRRKYASSDPRTPDSPPQIMRQPLFDGELLKLRLNNSSNEVKEFFNLFLTLPFGGERSAGLNANVELLKKNRIKIALAVAKVALSEEGKKHLRTQEPSSFFDVVIGILDPKGDHENPIKAEELVMVPDLSHVNRSLLLSFLREKQAIFEKIRSIFLEDEEAEKFKHLGQKISPYLEEKSFLMGGVRIPLQEHQNSLEGSIMEAIKGICGDGERSEVVMQNIIINARDVNDFEDFVEKVEKDIEKYSSSNVSTSQSRAQPGNLKRRTSVSGSEKEQLSDFLNKHQFSIKLFCDSVTEQRRALYQIDNMVRGFLVDKDRVLISKVLAAVRHVIENVEEFRKRKEKEEKDLGSKESYFAERVITFLFNEEPASQEERGLIVNPEVVSGGAEINALENLLREKLQNQEFWNYLNEHDKSFQASLIFSPSPDMPGLVSSAKPNRGGAAAEDQQLVPFVLRRDRRKIPVYASNSSESKEEEQGLVFKCKILGKEFSTHNPVEFLKYYFDHHPCLAKLGESNYNGSNQYGVREYKQDCQAEEVIYRTEAKDKKYLMENTFRTKVRSRIIEIVRTSDLEDVGDITKKLVEWKEEGKDEPGFNFFNSQKRRITPNDRMLSALIDPDFLSAIYAVPPGTTLTKDNIGGDDTSRSNAAFWIASAKTAVNAFYSGFSSTAGADAKVESKSIVIQPLSTKFNEVILYKRQGKAFPTRDPQYYKTVNSEQCLRLFLNSVRPSLRRHDETQEDISNYTLTSLLANLDNAFTNGRDLEQALTDFFDKCANKKDVDEDSRKRHIEEAVDSFGAVEVWHMVSYVKNKREESASDIYPGIWSKYSHIIANKGAPYRQGATVKTRPVRSLPPLPVDPSTSFDTPPPRLDLKKQPEAQDPREDELEIQTPDQIIQNLAESLYGTVDDVSIHRANIIAEALSNRRTLDFVNERERSFIESGSGAQIVRKLKAIKPVELAKYQYKLIMKEVINTDDGLKKLLGDDKEKTNKFIAAIWDVWKTKSTLNTHTMYSKTDAVNFTNVVCDLLCGSDDLTLDTLTKAKHGFQSVRIVDKLNPTQFQAVNTYIEKIWLGIHEDKWLDVKNSNGINSLNESHDSGVVVSTPISSHTVDVVEPSLGEGKEEVLLERSWSFDFGDSEDLLEASKSRAAEDVEQEEKTQKVVYKYGDYETTNSLDFIKHYFDKNPHLQRQPEPDGRIPDKKFCNFRTKTRYQIIKSILESRNLGDLVKIHLVENKTFNKQDGSHLFPKVEGFPDPREQLSDKMMYALMDAQFLKAVYDSSGRDLDEESAAELLGGNNSKKQNLVTTRYERLPSAQSAQPIDKLHSKNKEEAEFVLRCFIATVNEEISVDDLLNSLEEADYYLREVFIETFKVEEENLDRVMANFGLEEIQALRVLKGEELQPENYEKLKGQVTGEIGSDRALYLYNYGDFATNDPVDFVKYYFDRHPCLAALHYDESTDTRDSYDPRYLSTWTFRTNARFEIIKAIRSAKTPIGVMTKLRSLKGPRNQDGIHFFPDYSHNGVGFESERSQPSDRMLYAILSDDFLRAVSAIPDGSEIPCKKLGGGGKAPDQFEKESYKVPKLVKPHNKREFLENSNSEIIVRMMECCSEACSNLDDYVTKKGRTRSADAVNRFTKFIAKICELNKSATLEDFKGQLTKLSGVELPGIAKELAVEDLYLFERYIIENADKQGLQILKANKEENLKRIREYIEAMGKLGRVFSAPPLPVVTSEEIKKSEEDTISIKSPDEDETKSEPAADAPPSTASSDDDRLMSGDVSYSADSPNKGKAAEDLGDADADVGEDLKSADSLGSGSTSFRVRASSDPATRHVRSLSLDDGLQNTAAEDLGDVDADAGEDLKSADLLGSVSTSSRVRASSDTVTKKTRHVGSLSLDGLTNKAAKDLGDVDADAGEDLKPADPLGSVSTSSRVRTSSDPATRHVGSLSPDGLTNKAAEDLGDELKKSSSSRLATTLDAEPDDLPKLIATATDKSNLLSRQLREKIARDFVIFEGTRISFAESKKIITRFSLDKNSENNLLRVASVFLKSDKFKKEKECFKKINELHNDLIKFLAQNNYTLAVDFNPEILVKVADILKITYEECGRVGYRNVSQKMLQVVDNTELDLTTFQKQRFCEFLVSESLEENSQFVQMLSSWNLQITDEIEQEQLRDHIRKSISDIANSGASVDPDDAIYPSNYREEDVRVVASDHTTLGGANPQFISEEYERLSDEEKKQIALVRWIQTYFKDKLPGISRDKQTKIINAIRGAQNVEGAVTALMKIKVKDEEASVGYGRVSYKVRTHLSEKELLALANQEFVSRVLEIDEELVGRKLSTYLYNSGKDSFTSMKDSALYSAKFVANMFSEQGRKEIVGDFEARQQKITTAASRLREEGIKAEFNSRVLEPSEKKWAFADIVALHSKQIEFTSDDLVSEIALNLIGAYFSENTDFAGYNNRYRSILTNIVRSASDPAAINSDDSRKWEVNNYWRSVIVNVVKALPSSDISTYNEALKSSGVIPDTITEEEEKDLIKLTLAHYRYLKPLADRIKTGTDLARLGGDSISSGVTIEAIEINALSASNPYNTVKKYKDGKYTEERRKAVEEIKDHFKKTPLIRRNHDLIIKTLRESSDEATAAQALVELSADFTFAGKKRKLSRDELLALADRDFLNDIYSLVAREGVNESLGKKSPSRLDSDSLRDELEVSLPDPFLVLDQSIVSIIAFFEMSQNLQHIPEESRVDIVRILRSAKDEKEAIRLLSGTEFMMGELEPSRRLLPAEIEALVDSDFLDAVHNITARDLGDLILNKRIAALEGQIVVSDSPKETKLQESLFELYSRASEIEEVIIYEAGKKEEILKDKLEESEKGNDLTKSLIAKDSLVKFQKRQEDLKKRQEDLETRLKDLGVDASVDGSESEEEYLGSEDDLLSITLPVTNENSSSSKLEVDKIKQALVALQIEEEEKKAGTIKSEEDKKSTDLTQEEIKQELYNHFDTYPLNVISNNKDRAAIVNILRKATSVKKAFSELRALKIIDSEENSRNLSTEELFALADESFLKNIHQIDEKKVARLDFLGGKFTSVVATSKTREDGFKKEDFEREVAINYLNHFVGLNQNEHLVQLLKILQDGESATKERNDRIIAMLIRDDLNPLLVKYARGDIKKGTRLPSSEKTNFYAAVRFVQQMKDLYRHEEEIKELVRSYEVKYPIKKADDKNAKTIEKLRRFARRDLLQYAPGVYDIDLLWTVKRISFLYREIEALDDSVRNFKTINESLVLLEKSAKVLDLDDVETVQRLGGRGVGQLDLSARESENNRHAVNSALGVVVAIEKFYSLPDVTTLSTEDEKQALREKEKELTNFINSTLDKFKASAPNFVKIGEFKDKESAKKIIDSLRYFVESFKDLNQLPKKPGSGMFGGVVDDEELLSGFQDLALKISDFDAKIKLSDDAEEELKEDAEQLRKRPVYKHIVDNRHPEFLINLIAIVDSEKNVDEARKAILTSYKTYLESLNPRQEEEIKLLYQLIEGNFRYDESKADVQSRNITESTRLAAWYYLQNRSQQSREMQQALKLADDAINADKEFFDHLVLNSGKTEKYIRRDEKNLKIEVVARDSNSQKISFKTISSFVDFEDQEVALLQTKVTGDFSLQRLTDISREEGYYSSAVKDLVKKPLPKLFKREETEFLPPISSVLERKLENESTKLLRDNEIAALERFNDYFVSEMKQFFSSESTQQLLGQINEELSFDWSELEDNSKNDSLKKLFETLDNTAKAKFDELLLPNSHCPLSQIEKDAILGQEGIYRQISKMETVLSDRIGVMDRSLARVDKTSDIGLSDAEFNVFLKISAMRVESGVETFLNEKGRNLSQLYLDYSRNFLSPRLRKQLDEREDLGSVRDSIVEAEDAEKKRLQEEGEERSEEEIRASEVRLEKRQDLISEVRREFKIDESYEKDNPFPFGKFIELIDEGEDKAKAAVKKKRLVNLIKALNQNALQGVAVAMDLFGGLGDDQKVLSYCKSPSMKISLKTDADAQVEDQGDEQEDPPITLTCYVTSNIECDREIVGAMGYTVEINLDDGAMKIVDRKLNYPANSRFQEAFASIPFSRKIKVPELAGGWMQRIRPARGRMIRGVIGEYWNQTTAREVLLNELTSSKRENIAEELNRIFNYISLLEILETQANGNKGIEDFQNIFVATVREFNDESQIILNLRQRLVPQIISDKNLKGFLRKVSDKDLRFLRKRYVEKRQNLKVNGYYLQSSVAPTTSAELEKWQKDNQRTLKHLSGKRLHARLGSDLLSADAIRDYLLDDHEVKEDVERRRSAMIGRTGIEHIKYLLDHTYGNPDSSQPLKSTTFVEGVLSDLEENFMKEGIAIEDFSNNSKSTQEKIISVYECYKDNEEIQKVLQNSQTEDAYLAVKLWKELDNLGKTTTNQEGIINNIVKTIQEIRHYVVRTSPSSYLTYDSSHVMGGITFLNSLASRNQAFIKVLQEIDRVALENFKESERFDLQETTGLDNREQIASQLVTILEEDEKLLDIESIKVTDETGERRYLRLDERHTIGGLTPQRMKETADEEEKEERKSRWRGWSRKSESSALQNSGVEESKSDTSDTELEVKVTEEEEKSKFYHSMPITNVTDHFNDNEFLSELNLDAKVAIVNAIKPASDTKAAVTNLLAIDPKLSAEVLRALVDDNFLNNVHKIKENADLRLLEDSSDGHPIPAVKSSSTALNVAQFKTDLPILFVGHHFNNSALSTITENSERAKIIKILKSSRGEYDACKAICKLDSPKLSQDQVLALADYDFFDMVYAIKEGDVLDGLGGSNPAQEKAPANVANQAFDEFVFTSSMNSLIRKGEVGNINFLITDLSKYMQSSNSRIERDIKITEAKRAASNTPKASIIPIHHLSLNATMVKAR